MKKLISILVAFAMMAMLAVTAVFAADEQPGSNVPAGDAQKSKDAEHRPPPELLVPLF